MNGPNWLTIMNYTLVLVVLVAWLGLFISVGWELTEKRVRKWREMSAVNKEASAMLSAELHRMTIPKLGLTMADGGEELKDPNLNRGDKKH